MHTNERASDYLLERDRTRSLLQDCPAFFAQAASQTGTHPPAQTSLAALDTALQVVISVSFRDGFGGEVAAPYKNKHMAHQG